MHFLVTLASAWLVVSVLVAMLFGRFAACGRGTSADEWGVLQTRHSDGH